MRADVYLTLYGDVASRTRAQRLIADGCVRIDGVLLTRAHTDVDERVEHRLEIVDTLPFVGRGGLKLDGALDAFGVDCREKTALDIGASTGGFTDCLLQRGASLVFAVDSGSGQLAPSLREDERVINIENCNARYLCAEMLGGSFPASGADLAVMDVSFISQTFILPAISSVLSLVIFFMPTISGAFWIMSALTAQLYMIMYLFMFAAAIKLRYSKPDAVRPYKVPGGKFGMWCISGIAWLTSLFAIIVGFIPTPGVREKGTLYVLGYIAFLFIGTLVFILIPLWLYKYSKKSSDPVPEQ